MRITNDGSMNYCRWSSNPTAQGNISQISTADFFQTTMAPIRRAMVNGESLPGCSDCQHMDQRGKVSGRQKQLLKVGVRLDRFEKSLASSPWLGTFTDSECRQLPQDWQIDLGNYCNSACVFCDPKSSSKLATEWKRLGFIDELPKAAWVENPVLLNKFVETLKQTPNIQYLHFIGGETLITPAFKTILGILIDMGLNQSATIGFTTNLMAWDDSVVELLAQFSGVNLGMSIESFDAINEYVRWPARMPQVNENLHHWIALARQHNWLMQFRTTPTVLSVSKLLSVYDVAWQHNIAVESCNFLSRPRFMRPSVLPLKYRQEIIDSMQCWIDDRKTDHEIILNTRDPNVSHQQVVQDLESYVNYLKNEPDESHDAVELVAFLKRLESSRGNNILDYLPEYENFFRSAGY
jgi:sulfatase maturation enzyme AslB (radical SAM superfamily)